MGHPDHVCYSTKACTIPSCPEGQQLHRYANTCCEVCVSLGEYCTAQFNDCDMSVVSPVCSSSGVTYPNECAFNVDKCVYGNSQYIQATGACSSGTVMGTNSASNAESESSDNTTTIVVVICVIVLLFVIAVVGFVLYKRHRKKKSMESIFNGRYSLTNDSSISTAPTRGPSTCTNSTMSMENNRSDIVNISADMNKEASSANVMDST
eukprot:CFRG6932T1